MRVVIIEDETAAAINLEAILRECEPSFEVVASIESVSESVDYFKANPMPDLVFMDIHLADGESFMIFDRVDITAPIIFTTAYDEYALQAFEVNSVDYLLKPIRIEDLKRAIAKLRRLTATQSAEYSQRVERAVEVVRQESEQLQSLLVQVKDRIIPLSMDDVAFFHTSDDKVRAYTLSGEVYPIDRRLDALYTSLSADMFYRANRQFIISRRAVRDISVWFGSRLSINLTVDCPEKIVVAKARVGEFKLWLQSSRN